MNVLEQHDDASSVTNNDQNADQTDTSLSPKLQPQKKVKEGKKKKSIWTEIVQFAIIAIFIVLPFRLYIAQPFIVSGQSMEPTFENGQYLIVDQLTYHIEQPTRGAIIIFRYPRDPSKFFIKRVIGLPGEKVVITKGIVTIYNKQNPNGLTLDEPYIEFTKQDNFSIQLNNHQYFVLGDNRANSSDSRVWGPVDSKYLVGRPILRLLPLGQAAVLPGVETYKK